MAIIQISRIQHRRGLRIDLPPALNDAEFGWADDTRELFIGNGPLSPIGGNTQILTELTSILPTPYTYESNIGIDAITGFEHAPVDPLIPSANFPTVRTIQNRFDDYVSIMDYGAVGDGIADDTGALRRAIFDIYDETTSPLSVLRKFRSLYIPAGTYNITREILLYPFVHLFGDGIKRTKIVLLDAVVTPAIDQECVFRTVDSLGQIGASIDGLAARQPGNIIISDMTIESETSNLSGFSLGKIDIIKLEDAIDVKFINCEFIGTWTTSSPIFSRAIHISNPGATTGPMGNYNFDRCLFNGIAVGFNPTTDVSNVYIENSVFDTLHFGVILGDAVLRIVDLFRVSYSRFLNMENIAFDVQTEGPGNISSYNHYGTIATASAPAIRFAGLTDFGAPDDTSTGCVSLGDVFDDITVYSCADKLINTRVQNRSLLNVIMNSQDLFQIPTGFCGNILIGGDLTVTGSIISGATSSVAAAGVSVKTVSYTSGTGQAIFFDYVMKVPTENVYRIGTVNVIHDGSGSASKILFAENFTELDGPPSELIALQATFEAGDTIELTVIDAAGAALSPSFKFLTRTISL